MKFQGDEDVIQFFRFGPWQLSCPGPELDSWIATCVPREIGLNARHLWRHPNAEQLNARYARTLDVVGKCRLRRRAALNLVAKLIHEGNAAVDWKRSDADIYTLERKAEAEFLAHKKEAAHAARRLACVFANHSSLANWTATLAFLKGMEEKPIPDVPANEDGTLPMGLPTPFLHWKPPTSVAGENPRMADYLVALMERLAEESEAASAGGYYRRRHGPFYYPPGIASPRDGNDLLVNGLLYVSVRAARQATGAPDTRDVGAPMPEGGRSLYSLAAAYVYDVTVAAHPRGAATEFNDAVARDRLTKLLKRNPGLVCRGWAADRDR